MQSTANEVAKGTGMLILQRIITTVLGIILIGVMSRTFSYAEMGVFGAAELFFRITTIVAGLGLNFAASRYIPFLLATEQRAHAWPIAIKILILSVVPSCAFALATFILSENISTLFFGTTDFSLLFQIIAILAVVSILGLTSVDLIKGLRRFGLLSLFRVFAQLVRVILTVMFILIGIGVIIIYLGWIVFYLLLITLSVPVIFFTFRQMKNSGKNDVPKVGMKPVLSFSVVMMGFWFAKFIAESVDQFLVLNILGVEQLGIYTIVITITMFLVTILGMPVISTLTPGMSAAHGEQGTAKVGVILHTSTRYLAMIYFPVALLLAVLAPVVIGLVAGPNYFAASLPITIISLGISTYGFTSALISAITALGKTRIVFISFTGAFLFHLVSGILLIPLFGLIGAAIARSLTYLIILALMAAFATRYMPVKFDRHGILRSGAAAIIASITTLFFASCTAFALELILPYFSLSILIYMIALILFRTLKRADLRLIISLVPGARKLVSKISARPQLARMFKKLLADED